MSQRIGVLASNAEQITFNIDGEAATQCLRDEASFAFTQGDGNARRDDDGINVASYGDWFVFAPEHGMSL
jgi:hypothetical protein